MPDGWTWERLGNVTTIARGGSPRPIKSYLTTELDGVNWIKIGDTEKNGKYIFSTKEKIKPEGIAKSRYVKSGDFLLTNSMSFGRPYILKTDGCIHDGWLMIGNTEIVFNQDYLYYALSSDFMYNMLSVLAGGSTVDNLNSDLVKSLLFPIPPMQEQIIIANKAESLMKIVDTINNNEKELLKNIKSIKSKILDLAIRGKLVPQDPNDESASVLLERIRAEKEELIKQGKIKRDKKESVIFKGDDNSYYQDLPQNWQVSTLREVTTPLTLNDGDWILSENMTDNGEVKLLQLGSIGNMSYIDKGFKYLTKDTFDELSCTEIFAGYLIINRIISDKMCCCIVPDIDGTIITTVDTCWIAPSETSYDIKFLMYQLASPSFQSAVLLKATGTTRKRISKNNLIDLHLLLPPLAEQRRIVHTIEALFAQIDKISEQIS